MQTFAGEEIEYLFSDSPDEATFQGHTRPVWLTAVDVDVLQGMSQSTNYSITYPTSDELFAGLKHGDALTVDSPSRNWAGLDFMVRTVSQTGDGSLKEAFLYRP